MSVCGGLRTGEGGHDVVRGAAAVGVHPGHGLEDLAGTRVDQGVADAPAALVAVLPLDDVVAEIHGVGALGQQLDPEAALQARAVERLHPEAGALERRASDRLGNAAIDVVDQRIPDRARGIGGVLPLETMPGDPPALERRLDRLRVVLEADREEVHAGIELPRPITVVRERRERQVLPDGEGATVRHDRIDDMAGPVLRLKGEGELELGVQGITAGRALMDEGSVPGEGVDALTGARELPDHIEPIAPEELGGIDQYPITLLGDERQCRHRTGGERLGYRAGVSRVVREGATVAPILQDDDLCRADRLEARHIAATSTAAVEADGIRAQAGRERSAEEEPGPFFRELEPDAARTLVEHDGNQSIPALEARALRNDARKRGRLTGAVLGGERGGQHGARANEETEPGGRHRSPVG